MFRFRNSAVFVGTVVLASSCIFAAEGFAKANFPEPNHSTGISGTVQITGLTYTDTVDSVTSSGTTVQNIDSQALSTVSQVQYTMDGTDTYTVDVDADTEEATLTIDGVEYDLLDSYRDSTVYTYHDADDVLINITTKGAVDEEGTCLKFYQGSSQPNMLDYYTRAAAWIDSTGLLSDYSVDAALVGGETGNTSSVGETIISKGGYFSGYYIDGATYSISDLTMTLEGYGGDDFSGWGAGIEATGGANVTVDGAYIDTTGVIRTAIWLGGDDGTIGTITNSVIAAHNDDDATPYSDDDYYAVPMMEMVPFALGLTGNIRATNVLGNAEGIYSDSIVVSNVWGALSTDSGTANTHALDVTNVLSGIGDIEEAQDGTTYTATKEVNGVTYGFTMAELGDRAGYVTYADAGVYDTFYDDEFYAPDYIGIVAASGALMYLKDTYGYTERFGFMVHKNTGAENTGFATEDTIFSSDKGGVYIDGGEYHVKDAFVVVKSTSGNVASPNIEVNGADIDIYGTSDYSGTLLRLMESDDAGSPGTTEYTIDDLTTAEYDALSQEADENSDTTATFTAMTVTGNIYNTVTSVYQRLDVTLDDMKLTGAISSAIQEHTDADGNTDGIDGKTIYATTDGDYLYIGRVACTPYTTINNPIDLTLTNGTTWTVTNTSYVSELTVENGSQIKGKVEVDGKIIHPTEGTTYSDVTVLPASTILNYLPGIEAAARQHNKATANK